MIRAFLCAILLVANIMLYAQQPGIQPDDPAFIAKYTNLDFKGKFALAIDKDGSNNYFLLDFSRWSSRFERVYCINLTFMYAEIVNIDPDVNKNKVCFMANNNYQETKVLKIFDEISQQVKLVSADWQEDKKSEWLKKNDKYKL